jgi:hypothetical protein
VPYVRPSVHGPKTTGQSPINCFKPKVQQIPGALRDDKG